MLTLDEQCIKLKELLESFSINVNNINVIEGPLTTTFKVEIKAGIRVGRVQELSEEIALAIKANELPMISSIPHEGVIAIQFANIKRTLVDSTLINDPAFLKFKGQLPTLLGTDVNGAPVIFDIAELPHLLIGGSTGSGKSIALKMLIVSALSKEPNTRVLIIDPKQVEFSMFRNMPHLIGEIITDTRKALGALNVLVKIMESRFERFKQLNVLNIQEFNEASPEVLPRILVVIDELADLIMNVKDIETPLCFLAQKARAAGIHLLVATQRPSREVITGLIKANFPAQLAFRVPNATNSRIILDSVGAERLIGKGDFLLRIPNESSLIRGQAAYIDNDLIKEFIEVLSTAYRMDHGKQLTKTT